MNKSNSDHQRSSENLFDITHNQLFIVNSKLQLYFLLIHQPSAKQKEEEEEEEQTLYFAVAVEFIAYNSFIVSSLTWISMLIRNKDCIKTNSISHKWLTVPSFRVHFKEN